MKTFSCERDDDALRSDAKLRGENYSLLSSSINLFSCLHARNCYDLKLKRGVDYSWIDCIRYFHVFTVIHFDRSPNYEYIMCQNAHAQTWLWDIYNVCSIFTSLPAHTIPCVTKTLSKYNGPKWDRAVTTPQNRNMKRLLDVSWRMCLSMVEI